MNSLKVKILGTITLIVCLLVSVVSILEYQHQKRLITQISAQNAVLLTTTLQSTIENVMMSGRTDEVQRILGRLKEKDKIENLRIFDEAGRILNSAIKPEIGLQVGPADLAMYKEGKRIALVNVGNEDSDKIFKSIAPIYNKPACHACHDAGTTLLGALEVELSIRYLESYLDQDKFFMSVSMLTMVVLILATIFIFLHAYVNRPLKAIISSMQGIERGDFDVKTDIASSTEMKALSDNFNMMVSKLRYFVDTTIGHERELARAQSKLAHHHEMHLMNQKLEDQLREIENLNVGMEERIEEIEEANYRIADLASELEDKNVNLERAVARLSTLYKVGLAVNSTMESKKIFDLIVRTAVETLNAEIGYIILYNQQGRNLLVTTLLGHEVTPEASTILQMKPSSVSTWVVENRTPLLIPDINEFPQFDRFSALGYERKNLICAPLMIKDEIIGTITAVNKRDSSTYNAEELELLVTIAAQASIAIKNAQLYDEQQATYLHTIQALVSAIEASDSYTRGHSERVTRYSLELARKLTLPPERLKIIERAAILHDIGKIGIDLNLLHKEGKLSPEEIHDLQQHPVIGMRILEPIDFLQDVRICIGQHHERYDGRGYPNRIPAGELLLESRILAIADAFDAMTSDRPYRKALPVEAAAKELIDHAGAQFDPELVPHFIELIESGTFGFSCDKSDMEETPMRERRKVVPLSDYGIRIG
ncbi:sensor cyclic diguanylate phosphodiesterase, HAMP and GAF domain-containing, putative heme-binding site [Geobacter metallireducens GS-15]|uniref:Sensor cyclic diguanylate phosphodiesterase, HAMP and GAF domain-containing, putative heme-binding site n=1 Tax=Geobacter metallireducens (strain ATCC 53774 / DSM 7210 / GS-15) TaxID=269799 RepID=Q39XD3_GEOMG|nr:HD domain-containing phosphohydrolase [Geobacter metallireducens]ABB31091.1 sensor cyclic diguanylate phosphodiesterase, HAMP and GAF domain-containing, putative heme-binding site [Geobacter metallireducens GS-15]